MEVKKRIVSYDIVRTIAIVLVVLCHAIESVYVFDTGVWNNSSFLVRIIIHGLYVFGRLGVPLFLFLTGALVLKKNIEDDEGVLKFYKKNLLPLVIAYVIWVLLYNLIAYFYDSNSNITIISVVKDLLFLSKGYFSNMWYIPMIIGLYLGLPFVSVIVKSFSKKSIKLILIIQFIIVSFVPLIHSILLMFNIDIPYDIMINVPFLAGGYGLYIIMGYYITNKNVEYKPIKYLLLLGFFYLLTLLFQLFSFSKYSNMCFTVWYNFPTLLIGSVYLFKFIICFNYSKISKTVEHIFTFISKISLGIFFVHILIIMLFKKYFQSLDINVVLKVLCMLLISFFISVIINYLITRVKFLSKYLILEKN